MTKIRANKKFLLVLAGPTASGKTALAIELAKYFNTEIISADSRQIYKEMQIGTAVPGKANLLAVKHHFVQNRSIEQPFDVATYEQDVLNLLDKLFETSDIIILTGGSGLFIDAVCRGLDTIPETTIETRKKVQLMFEEEGIISIQQALFQVDPDYYKTVDKLNPRRLQRALEVYYQTGTPFSYFRKRLPRARNFEVIWTALNIERVELINNINLRVEKMMAAGLLTEARNLQPKSNYNALNTVGYQELFDFFEGKTSLEQAVENIKINTRRYAKRQMTWFRRNKDYRWFKPSDIKYLIKYVEQRMSD